MSRESIYSFTPEGLTNILSEEYGAKPFVARQLLRWIYERGVDDFESMTDLGRELRTRLSSRFDLSLPVVEKKLEAKDGKTIKVVLRLSDTKLIECVLMCEDRGTTLCLSSQVGCAQACIFCATGQMGILRNLTAGEIVAQFLVLRKLKPKAFERPPRIVFMGMGEPFHNMNQLFKALETMIHENGLNIGARRITVSTSGVVKGIYRLMELQPQVQLAISLHTVEPGLRRLWVPNCKDSVDDILTAARVFTEKTGRKITFEMVLFGGEQMQTAKLNKLGKKLQGILCAINVIPYNPIPQLDEERYVRPSHQEIEYFKSVLSRWHREVTVRISRGRDIQAACGQLLPQTPDLKAGEPVIRG